MRPIDAALLHELAQGGNATIMAGVAPELEAGAAVAWIDTPLRAAHFLAQIAEESGRFTRLEEDLDYSAARIAEVWGRLAPRADALAHNPVQLANAAYATHGGNRGEAFGDGWAYRGRGLIQLTGRWNYMYYGGRIREDLEHAPDRASMPAIAARLALAFWTARSCNADADRDDTEAVTRRINGGINGLEDRKALKHRAYELLTAPVAVA